jgi:hypothetical protein
MITTVILEYILYTLILSTALGVLTVLLYATFQSNVDDRNKLYTVNPEFPGLPGFPGFIIFLKSRFYL